MPTLKAGPHLPSWAAETVLYQVFPDRFARSAAADRRPAPDWAVPARWDEPVVGKGAAVLGAAATAGFAVSVLSMRAAPLGTVDVGAALSLPPIPAQDVMLYSALNDRRSRDALRTLVLAFQRTR